MWKVFFAIIVMQFISNDVTAQSWYKLIIRDEVTISFPEQPEHRIIDDKGKEAYIVRTDGCSFMVGISSDAIEDYESYLRMSDSQQVTKALLTLEGVANGKINAKKQYLISMKSFRSPQGYIGLDVEYATLNPNNPDSKKRFSTLILINNTLYIFDCWFMDTNDHSIEKDKFFQSLLLKG
jgi:hypothetical protein